MRYIPHYLKLEIVHKSSISFIECPDYCRKYINTSNAPTFFGQSVIRNRCEVEMCIFRDEYQILHGSNIILYTVDSL